ncbi:spermatogenesis-associated serine-rich protein 2-like isoform X2 [Ornithodoros turicata]|uniref:spermatogenesis-associated serine-rich protein 2-like isoform X2 n=1 Tax=Ornithodoros turicata TaxID=34597 RepID=UPI00313873E4
MARKTGVQSIYDTRNNVALADGEQHGPVDLKEKLSKVREVVPSMSKDQICMALRSYDYDVNATITAISENGPEEALREWNCAGNKMKSTSRNKKRKKNKGKKEQASASGPAGEGPNGDLDDDLKKETDSPKAENVMEEEPVSATQALSAETAHENGGEPDKEDIEQCGWGDQDDVIEPAYGEEESTKDDTKSEEAVPAPELKNSRMHSVCAFRSRSYHSSVRTKNGPDVKSTSNGTNTLPKKTCLEKSLKDLSRQTVALQRVQVLLEDELHKAEKALKATFVEVQKMLSERQAHLEVEMEKMKSDARGMLQRRQKLAAELKARSETAPMLSESDLLELRDDIKHFVVERKYDDELGKTVRFTWTRERIEKEIKELGQVIAVKDPYTCRRLSMSSCTSSNYPDSFSQISSTSNPTCRNQYYAFEPTEDHHHTSRRTEGTHVSSGYGRMSESRGFDCRSSKVYHNSRGYSGPPLGARSSSFSRGGRTRRLDDTRFGRGERTGYGSGRPPPSHRMGRGRYESGGRREEGSSGHSATRRPSVERVRP